MFDLWLRDSLYARTPRVFATLVLFLIVGCSESSSVESESPARDDAQRDSLGVRIDALQRSPDSRGRTRAFLELADKLDEFTTRELTQTLGDRSGQLRVVDLLLLVEGWSAIDPEAASLWARLQPEPIGTIMRHAALFAWSRSDPIAALDSLQNITAADLNTLIPGWMDSGKPGLEEFVLSLGFDPIGQAAISAYAGARVDRDGAQAVIDWVERQADRHQGKMLLNLFRQTLGRVSLVDPDAAFAFCERHCEGPHGKALRQKIAQNAARLHGRKTMEWLAASRDADPRELEWAIRAGFQSWLSSANADALSWAAENAPEHRLEDWFGPLVPIYVNGIYRDRPDEAVEWAAWIKDPSQREAILIQVAQRWRERDAEAAEAWLVSSNLSEIAREAARQLPQPRRRTPGQ